MNPPNCHESLIYSINKINFSEEIRKGIARLQGLNSDLNIVWSIVNFPMEVPGMPGAPFAIQVNYTIFDKTTISPIKMNYNSYSGSFIFEINSGTLPKYSDLGIPIGTYISMAKSNTSKSNRNITIILTETSAKLFINY
jgi:hypothetical protein